ncbi:unnamed protein product [marine sediment metagenome]|uniref:Uncharacterized protein n=1 Tax=marine sediment metagenome TaxID=412755 RepID=X1S4P3_9ZZZZ
MSELIKTPDEHPDKYLDMPQGLEGYWWETEHLICVPFVESRNEGAGNFSRFLEDIESKGKMVFFPTIVSARLDAILRKRGYTEAVSRMSELEQKIHGQEYCDGLAREPTK